MSTRPNPNLPPYAAWHYDAGMKTVKAGLGQHNQQVLSLLRRSRQPLTAYAILDKLRADGVKAPTTVYRALSALTREGLAHRIESLNAYVACQHEAEDGDHAHGGQFAICTGCGTVEELDLTPLAPQLQKAGKKFLTTVHHKMVEISGTCHACAKRGA